jgi:hypothetical protein
MNFDRTVKTKRPTRDSGRMRGGAWVDEEKEEEDWRKNHPSIGYFMQLQKKIEQELAEGGSKKEKKNWLLMRRPEVS